LAAVSQEIPKATNATASAQYVTRKETATAGGSAFEIATDSMHTIMTVPQIRYIVIRRRAFLVSFSFAFFLKGPRQKKASMENKIVAEQ
jgi:hypothetical protein